MTRDEFVRSVADIIANNQRGDTGIKASTLGNMILRSLPDNWRVHGFQTLKSLLELLQDQGAVQLKDDLRGSLAVLWTGSHIPPVPPSPARRLRKEVWVAFVNNLPLGARFLQRTTGNVVMGQTNSPQPADQWVEVKRIPDETQKAWVREILDKAQNPALREHLGDPLWFVRLPEELRRERPDMLTQWNRVRTSRVVEYVESWCAEYAVPLSSVMEHAPSPVAQKQNLSIARNEQSVRHQILDALARMTTDELLEIPIPAKHLIVGSGN